MFKLYSLDGFWDSYSRSPVAAIFRVRMWPLCHHRYPKYSIAPRRDRQLLSILVNG
ncbi:hypothetical protein [Microcoleus anatoxicus]|uniref:Uncharacterized protein n=1 Tax=Microcoleus anatoxicus PTRS2 TaxID=2705321 RepID=A0ABU8YNX2_9CYAN